MAMRLVVGLIFQQQQVSSILVTPLGKVVELIDVLEEHLDEDTKKDGDHYAEYASQTVPEIADAKRVVSETKNKIKHLQTDLDEEAALRASKHRDLETAASELTKTEKELADGKTEREKEHKLFVQNDKIFAESLEQLTRSLEVLAKRFQGEDDRMDLMQIASNLQSTLEQSKDFMLSASQREILHSFTRFVRSRVKAQNENFLQRHHLEPENEEVEPENEEAVYGRYQSQKNPVVETLTKVKRGTEDNRETARTQESNAVEHFVVFEEDLNTQISTAETRMEELKSQIAESQERSGELTADLLASKELLEATQKHVDLLEEDFQIRTHSFKQRALKRSDELTAVKEAIQVLTSETAKQYVSKQSVGSVEPSAQQPIDFFQTSERFDHSQARLDLVEDPFGKVKRMVRQMLDKLIDQSSKDADQQSFCETEMTKSVESLYSKSNDIQKLSDRLLFMNADIDRLATELAQTRKELHDANQVLAAAAEMRNKEKLRSTQAAKDYSGAQSLLTDAIGILKKFYSKQAIEADTAETTGSKEVYGERNREGLGHGIVAILEIAIQDFSELEDDAQQEESKSEQMFKDMTLETRVRIAKLDKNIEFMTRKKVKTEGEQARAQADLKSYRKEVSAIEDYLAQLKAQCIAKADPYEVRKERRDKELKGLQEALQFLSGNG